MKEDETFYTSLVKGSNFKLNEGERCLDLCEKCLMLNKPYLCSDENEFDSLLTKSGVKVVVPMLIQNEIKGFIFLAEKITKQPYTQSDLEFMQTLGNVAVISLENVRLFQETLEKKKLEEELALARNIQNRLLPKQMPVFPNITLHGVNVPSKFVGGDYFDIIQLEENLLGITIADVSGKGIPASLLMSNLQASLHSLIRENIPLDKLVGKINNIIYNNTDPEKYITFFYGQLNLKNLDIDYVNAGHNPPYLIHTDDDIEELSQGGIILGMMPDMSYEIGHSRLKRGDTLLLFTDGVTETMTPDDEEYEEKRLIEFMKRTCSIKQPEEINKKLIQELNDFAGHAPQTDDITILTLQIP
jgi:sigma-B regulation protein RsbU (phosphoserine phosphatase)